MSTSDQTYYLKDGKFYKILGGKTFNVTSEEVESSDKPSLLISDEYFFYIGMDSLSVSNKKMHSIAKNYLSVMFPHDLTKLFGTVQAGSANIIFLVSDELNDMIEKYTNIFQKTRKISTPFIELSSLYEDFIFSDGNRFYKKDGASLSIQSEAPKDYITIDNLLSETSTIKMALQIPGIKKSSLQKNKFILPWVMIGTVYLIFLLAYIIEAYSASKIDRIYEGMLNQVYKNAGVAQTSDPYGMLLYKSKQVKDFTGKRVLSTLAELADAFDQGVSFSTMSIRDKAVRAEGTAKDFAQIEEITKFMQTKLKLNVTMDDTKKTDEGVSFVMKYEYK